MLIASMALNAVFAVGFVVNHFFRNDRVESFQEASKPGMIGPVKRWRIKNTIKKCITDSFADDDIKYISKDFYIEKAYVCPFNEKYCVEAAIQIMNLKDQIRSYESQVQNTRTLLKSQPDNENTQAHLAMLEGRLAENREALAANERIILTRDSQHDGKFMGYFVRHKFRVEANKNDWTDYNKRFMINTNGKLVLFNQDLGNQSAFNYDRTSDVIRSVLAR